MKRILILEHIANDEMCRVVQGERWQTPGMAVVLGLYSYMEQTLIVVGGHLLNAEFIGLPGWILVRITSVHYEFSFSYLFPEKAKVISSSEGQTQITNKLAPTLLAQNDSPVLDNGIEQLFCFWVCSFLCMENVLPFTSEVHEDDHGLWKCRRSRIGKICISVLEMLTLKYLLDIQVWITQWSKKSWSLGTELESQCESGSYCTSND